MIRRVWVDVAVAAVTVLAVAIIASTDTAAAPDRRGWAFGGLALLVLTYLCARPTLGSETPRRFALTLAGAATAQAVMAFAEPSLATMQVIVYPLVWIVSPSRRHGVAGSVVVGASVFAGYAASFGPDPAALGEAAAVAVLSCAFSVAMGSWFAAVAEYGEERARLLAELTSSQAEVAALSRETGAAHERERFAREIHDTLAQTLAGLVMLAEQAGRRARSGDGDGSIDAVVRLEAVAREALGEARAIVARTAAVPDDAALSAAVERLCERFRADTGLDIDVDVAAAGGPVDRDTQVVVLRCLQEALSNIGAHAAARRVSVCVRSGEGGARMTVSDDGVGFDVRAQRVGYGLDGMRDRVALAGGELSIVSSDRGTTLDAMIPASQPVGGRA